MNTVIIFAGGVGSRMRDSLVPKQFLKIYDKEILAYTIEVFEKNTNIDNILVVILQDWIDYTKRIIAKNSFKKVIDVIPGGSTAIESQFKGIEYLKNRFFDQQHHLVLMHDGVRPMIDDELIDNNIMVAREKGNAISASESIETVVYCSTGFESGITEILNRDLSYVAKAPQTFHLDDLYEMHIKAGEEGKQFIDSASMMFYYGTELNLVYSPKENMKITTKMDYYYFRAILNERENSQFIVDDANE